MDVSIKNRLKDIKKLCELYDIKTMYLYGSAIAGGFNKNSDIDLLISFKEGIGIDKYTDNYFKLRKSLEKLFDRKVELVTESSLTNPYLIESIEKQKKLIYAS